MFSKHDKEILRPLLEWQMAVANSAEVAYRRELWRRVNDLEKGERPPILVYPEGSWREINETIELHCQGDAARELELNLRRQKFSYENIGDDMVINPYLEIPHVYTLSDYGVEIKHIQIDAIGSWKPEPPLKDLQKDLGKLHYRSVIYDAEGTKKRLEECQDCCEGIMPVHLSTCYFWSLGMTSEALNLYGLQEFMLAMYDDPDGLHALMKFLMDEHANLVRQLEELQLVTYNSEMWHIGSGGLGFTKSLPGFTRPGDHPPVFRDNWGLLESQETVGVSPEMFAEFIAPYQKQLAPLFGKLYYGCCEPVEKRFEYIKEFANLRGISVSPWSDVALCSEQYQNNYAMFCKPNPSSVAADFIEEAVVRDLENIAGHIRNNSAAIILKDLHTVQHDLTRYRRWTDLARKAIDKYLA